MNRIEPEKQKITFVGNQSQSLYSTAAAAAGQAQPGQSCLSSTSSRALSSRGCGEHPTRGRSQLHWVCRVGKSPACRTGLPCTSCSGLGVPKRMLGPYLVQNPPTPETSGSFTSICSTAGRLPRYSAAPRTFTSNLVINRLFCSSPGGKGRQPAGVQSTARSRTALTRLKMLLRRGRDPAPSEG